MIQQKSLKDYFTQGDNLSRLIYINIAVFLVFLILRIIDQLFQVSIGGFLGNWLSLPSHFGTFITRPWTIFTYMFLHSGFFHILFNLIVLYFSGRMFQEFLGDKRLLGTFLIGGLAGGVLYLILYNIAPALLTQQSVMVGASAGVMAVLVGIAAYVPNMPVRLFFVLEVKLWMIATGLVFFDLINFHNSNTGGHIAHLGGAAAGYFIVRGLRKGKDYSEGFLGFWQSLYRGFVPKKPKFKSYKNPNARYRKSDAKASDDQQKKLDEILDKIRDSGYDNLTKEEKEFLFKYSNK